MALPEVEGWAGVAGEAGVVEGAEAGSGVEGEEAVTAAGSWALRIEKGDSLLEWVQEEGRYHGDICDLYVLHSYCKPKPPPK